ncbi:MAG: hypothetical protein ACRDF4_11110 [Rhabdochlamydiaceae bacterium]
MSLGIENEKMTRLNLNDTRNSERKIQELKNNIAGVSEERWRAALAKDQNAVARARLKASEKTLENCDAIAGYLNHFSPPLSNEIRMREQNARNSLQQIKSTTNSREIHDWIKSELIPPTKMAERLAHLAATSVRKAQGEDLGIHKWTGPR